MVEADDIQFLVGALDGPDPIRALEAAAALQEDTSRMTTVLVRRARNAGCTWAEIAAALGVSRQAVHKRFGR